MRIHDIEKMEKPETGWIFVATIRANKTIAMCELRKLALHSNAYKWRLIPYSKVEQEIQEIYP